MYYCIDGTCKIMNFCTFCKMATETIAHVLYECPLVQIIWTHFQQHFLSRDLQCPFTLSNILCNNVMPALKHGVNSLVPMITYYIFCSKCSLTIPNIDTAWQYIHKLVNIDKEIVTYHVLLDKFEQKWFFCIMNIIHVYVILYHYSIR